MKVGMVIGEVNENVGCWAEVVCLVFPSTWQDEARGSPDSWNSRLLYAVVTTRHPRQKAKRRLKQKTKENVWME